MSLVAISVSAGSLGERRYAVDPACLVGAGVWPWFVARWVSLCWIVRAVERLEDELAERRERVTWRAFDPGSVVRPTRPTMPVMMANTGYERPDRLGVPVPYASERAVVEAVEEARREGLLV